MIRPDHQTIRLALALHGALRSWGVPPEAIYVYPNAGAPGLLGVAAHPAVGKPLGYVVGPIPGTEDEFVRDWPEWVAWWNAAETPDHERSAVLLELAMAVGGELDLMRERVRTYQWGEA